MRRLKYHNAFVDRLGVTRHYFRRNGKRVALRGPFGSKAFWDDYNASLDIEPIAKPDNALPARDTFAGLASLYFGSPSFRALASSSRANYRRVIGSFLVKHGQRRVDQLRREHVDIIIGDMSGTPGAAIVLLKRIRTLLKYGVAIKLIDHDPTAGATSYRSKEFHTWTEAELEKFEAHWPSGTRERLAYSLLLYTGQRGSDVHRMSRTDIAGDAIHVVQQKTDQEDVDEKLEIPMHPNLQRELALHRRQHIAILVTVYGKPFTVKGFGNFVSDAIGAAGLPTRCKAHGLRKAAARRLAEAGCSAKQIQAITGHKSLSEVERYTRKADQRLLARQAIDAQKQNDPKTKSGKLG